jgi:hypothetical protein
MYEWNPWSMFLMLDYFSRGFFVGVLCLAGWGYWNFVRFWTGIRSKNWKDHSFSQNEFSRLNKLLGNLHSIESFVMVLTSGCCANQIFAVWFTYMARVTDANPFFALREAWMVTQILMCLIVSLDALSRFALAVLERKRSLLHD